MNRKKEKKKLHKYMYIFWWDFDVGQSRQHPHKYNTNEQTAKKHIEAYAAHTPVRAKVNDEIN